MKKTTLFKRITAFTLALLLTFPFSAMSQQLIEIDRAAQRPERIFMPEELEQMLAPIALYPDALLAQVLAAATYPLEVVAADRFLKENQGLSKEALWELAKDKDWEPSVKAMLEFPDVLAMMDAQLEWTEKLGDAFLVQQNDCMDAIQRLRQRAYAQGNLVTTGQQVIRVEAQTQIIIIEPARPEVVYVPVYDTAIIYGQWGYPGYEPYYFYPTRYSGLSFLAGVFVGAFWGSWGTWDCNWHSRDVHINVDHYNRFTRASYARGDRTWSYKAGQGDQPWRYDARHRMNAGPGDYTARRGGEQQRLGLAAKTASPAINARESARPAIKAQERQHSALNAESGTSVVRKNSQDTARSSTINSRENTGAAFNAPKDSRNNQAGMNKQPTKKEPQARVDARSDAGNQGGMKASVRASRVQKSTTSSILPSNVKSDPRGRMIARQASGDSNRRKADTRALADKGEERRIQATNYNVQFNSQITPPSKNSDVLREGPISVMGR